MMLLMITSGVNYRLEFGISIDGASETIIDLVGMRKRAPKVRKSPNLAHL